MRTWLVAVKEAFVGMKPEKKASVLLDMMFWMGVHGLSNVDWTTEWFYSKIVNQTAQMVLGGGL